MANLRDQVQYFIRKIELLNDIPKHSANCDAYTRSNCRSPRLESNTLKVISSICTKIQGSCGGTAKFANEDIFVLALKCAKNIKKIYSNKNDLTKANYFIIKLAEMLKAEDTETWRCVADVIFNYGFKKNAVELKECIAKCFVDYESLSKDVQKRHFDKLWAFLQSVYLDINSPTVYSLIFNCIWRFNDFGITLKLFILMLNFIGFEMQSKFLMNKVPRIESDSLSVDRSMQILQNLLQIFRCHNVDYSYSVQSTTIVDIMKIIAVSVLNVPNFNYPGVVINCFHITPFMIPSIAPSILKCCMTNNFNYECHQAVFQALIDLYDTMNCTGDLVASIGTNILYPHSGTDIITFAKLRYLLPVDQEMRYGTCTCDLNMISLDPVLLKLATNITKMSCWQTFKMFQKCIELAGGAIMRFHDQSERRTTDCCTLQNIQILMRLLVMVFDSQRLAERFTPKTVKLNFSHGIHEFCVNLQIFANALLRMEHNAELMLSFLSVNISWTRLCLILAYYNKGLKPRRHKPQVDLSSLPSVLYLYNSVTLEKWCLIVERIQNFGDMRCKNLLLELLTYNWKWYKLHMEEFDSIQYTEVPQCIKQYINEEWKCISPQFWMDLFTVNYILPHLPQEILVNIVTCIYDTYPAFFDQPHIQDNILIARVCMASIFNRIASLTDSYVLCYLWQNEALSLIESKLLDSESRSEIFSEFIQRYHCNKHQRSMHSVCEDNLHLLQIISKLRALVSLTPSLQCMIVLSLIAIHNEALTVRYDAALKCIEDIMLGFLGRGPLLLLYSNTDILNIIIHEFLNSSAIFIHVINSIFRNDDSFNSVCFIAKTFMKNIGSDIKYLEYWPTFMDHLSRVDESNRSPHYKEQCAILRKSMCEHITLYLSNTPSSISLIDIYTNMLKICIIKSSVYTKQLAILKNLLPNYLNLITSNLMFDPNNKIKICNLLNLLLTNFCTFNLSPSNILKFIENVECPIYIYELYGKMLTNLIPDKEYLACTRELLRKTDISIKNNENRQLCGYIKIWQSLVNIKTSKIRSLILTNHISAIIRLLSSQGTDTSVTEQIMIFMKSIASTTMPTFNSDILDQLIYSSNIVLFAHVLPCSKAFRWGISILSALITKNHVLMTTRLHIITQQYNTLLEILCMSGNSEARLSNGALKILAHDGLILERFVFQLVRDKSQIMTILCTLIALTLFQCQKFTLISTLKAHVNNCLYIFMDLLNAEYIDRLLPILDDTSKKLFHISYANYETNYKFKGKV